MVIGPDVDVSKAGTGYLGRYAVYVQTCKYGHIMPKPTPVYLAMAVST